MNYSNKKFSFESWAKCVTGIIYLLHTQISEKLFLTPRYARIRERIRGIDIFPSIFLQTVNGSENSNQLCVSYTLTVRKSVRNAFSRNLETWILKIERLWSKQTVKKLNLWGKTVVDKSTWIEDCGRKVCRKILCTYKMDDISKNYGNTYKVNELLERLS